MKEKGKNSDKERNIGLVERTLLTNRKERLKCLRLFFQFMVEWKKRLYEALKEDKELLKLVDELFYELAKKDIRKVPISVSTAWYIAHLKQFSDEHNINLEDLDLAFTFYRRGVMDFKKIYSEWVKKRLKLES